MASSRVMRDVGMCCAAFCVARCDMAARLVFMNHFSTSSWTCRPKRWVISFMKSAHEKNMCRRSFGWKKRRLIRLWMKVRNSSDKSSRLKTIGFDLLLNLKWRSKKLEEEPTRMQLILSVQSHLADLSMSNI